MARIAGINIPTNKRVEVGLTYVYGIGPSTARKILADAKIDPDTSVKDLTEDEVVKLREAVEALNVEEAQSADAEVGEGRWRNQKDRRGVPAAG